MSDRIAAKNELSRIFGGSAKPVWVPPTSTKHKTLPGWFPTAKCAQGLIRYRSPLMADGLMHIDTDPQVARIAPYPATVVYGRRNAKGLLQKHDHVPDVAVRRKDGVIVFIDFVPYRISQALGWYATRELDLREYFADIYDCHYIVLDERSIYAQPLFNNIKTIWSHKAVPNGNLPYEKLKQSLRTQTLPATLGALLESLKIKAQSELFAPAFEGAHERDVTFAGVMQLVISGDLEIDLDCPISASSNVRKYGSALK